MLLACETKLKTYNVSVAASGVFVYAVFKRCQLKSGLESSGEANTHVQVLEMSDRKKEN